MDVVGLIVGLVVGLAVGAAAVLAVYKAKASALESQVEEAEDRARVFQTQVAELQKSLLSATEEKAKFEAQAAQAGDLKAELDRRDEYEEGLRQDIAEYQRKIATFETTLAKEREAFEEKKAILERAQVELKQAFDALSREALTKNNEEFLKLANDKLKQFQEAAEKDLGEREKRIEEVVKPVKETLEKFDQKVQEIEKERVGAYEGLKEQVRNLQTMEGTLLKETTNLVRALKNPGHRGRWGEVHLKRIVEMAGMLEYVDFNEQVSTDSEEGRLRPDMVVRLPNGRQIIVDSKVALDAYLDAYETDDEALRAQKLAVHAQQVKQHVQRLSQKSYWERFPSLEFVVMFMHVESAWGAALQEDPSLIEYGASNKVVVATPTTLIALLKAVAYGWRQEQIAKNAQEISNRGAELYKGLVTMFNHVSNLGRYIDRSVAAYNQVIGSLERNVLPKARDLNRLQGSSAGEIDELPMLDTMARDPKAPELQAAVGVRDGGTEGGEGETVGA